MTGYDAEDYMMFALGCLFCLLLLGLGLLISALAYRALFDPSSLNDAHYTIINGHTTTVAP